MTKTRVGDAFMPADEYGRSLPRFSVNLLMQNLEASLKFNRGVLDVTVRYSDNDFAALFLARVDFMLHGDHSYDHHPLYPFLIAAPMRGAGAELRVLGVDPDTVEEPSEAEHPLCNLQRTSARSLRWNDPQRFCTNLDSCSNRDMIMCFEKLHVRRP